VSRGTLCVRRFYTYVQGNALCETVLYICRAFEGGGEGERFVPRTSRYLSSNVVSFYSVLATDLARDVRMVE
jgi:hypothetical protein